MSTYLLIFQLQLHANITTSEGKQTLEENEQEPQGTKYTGSYHIASLTRTLDKITKISQDVYSTIPN